jgi:uncharacterized protein YdhG (YjbR/CyaY superfamily)
MTAQNKPDNVDQYILSFPEEIRKRLHDIRQTIKKAAPEAVEKIGYGMPAYTYKGMLLYFAAHTNHIGVYPYPSAMEAFKKELTRYKTSRGTIQFLHSEPVPLKLLGEIIRFRIEENKMKEEDRRQKRLKRPGKK